MDIETLRDYCLSKAGATEDLPFGDETLVFKVCGKIFLLVGLTNPQSFNVKCDPEMAIQLREEFSEVRSGYHMNKKHWNTVSFKGVLTKKQLLEMIDHSYDLVFKSLPKAKQQGLS
jgi:predicted DNA-binding protein (MmcQ/YjbR family)